MIPSPLELNDAIVSTIKRFVTIGGESFETFLDKSRIVIFIVKPAAIGFFFATFFFRHRFLVLYSLPLDLCNFVTDGLGVGVVVEVNARSKIADTWFPKASDVVDSIFFLWREGEVEHLVDRSHGSHAEIRI